MPATLSGASGVRPVAISVEHRSPYGGVSMLARRLLSCARAHTRAFTAMPAGSRALTPTTACFSRHAQCHVRHAAARGTAHQRLAVQPARLGLASPPVASPARLATQRVSAAASGTTSPVSEAAASPAGDVSAPAGAHTATPSSHKVVTFYCLTRVEDPHGEVEKHKAFCQVCTPPAADTQGCKTTRGTRVHRHTPSAGC
jgi:hypothetical protein